MLFTTGAILFGALSISQSHTTRQLLGFLLGTFIISVSTIHSLLGQEKPFRVGFGLMVATVAIRCRYLLWTRISDPKVAKGMKNLALFGAGKFQHPFSWS
jgi:hypothetical protein